VFSANLDSNDLGYCSPPRRLCDYFHHADDREKKEEESLTRLRKWRKAILVGLTIVALIVGLGQIRKSDRESRKAEKDHIKEHGEDQRQNSVLQQSIKSLHEENQLQYDRNQNVLHDLQQQVAQLKLGKLTAEDREKISVLEAQLKAALAPKPKAKMAFGFYEPNMKKGDNLQVEKLFSIEGEVLKLNLALHNTSDVRTGNITGWVHLCNECKLHNEPPDSIKERGASDLERHYRIADVPPGVFVQIADVELEIPLWMTRMPISFAYTCDECNAQLDEQTVWANIARIPAPKQPVK
jgi:hypothetical protein